MRTLFLIHGGIWQEIDADRFWTRPGITAGLRERGFTVLAPDRLPNPADWTAEVTHLLPLLPADPVTVVAGSNGCSAAARLALAAPDLVERVLFAWPATANDPAADERSRLGLTRRGAPPHTITALLTGETLRGVSDAELSTLRMPVAVLPSVPDNPTHQRATVDKLRTLLPHAVELPGCPEPPQPDFPPHRDTFLSAAARWCDQ